MSNETSLLYRRLRDAEAQISAGYTTKGLRQLLNDAASAVLNIDAAVAAERERCARLAESHETSSTYRMRQGLADAIRQAPAE